MDDVAVLAAFDFTIALLITVVTVLLGQAMTRYELFTGKALPQRGLARHWVQAIALAAGYGVLLGGALVLGLEPVYAVLLTAVLMTVFFVLLSWQSSVEWRKAMRQLRPIVTSEGWYERLTSSGAALGRIRSQDPFRVLCEEVMGAPLAFLIPAGPLASFVTPQAYPPRAPLPAKSWAPDDAAPEQLAIPVPPEQYGGANWAVPLWSERGLTGVLLLGRSGRWQAIQRGGTGDRSGDGRAPGRRGSQPGTVAEADGFAARADGPEPVAGPTDAPRAARRGAAPDPHGHAGGGQRRPKGNSCGAFVGRSSRDLSPATRSSAGDYPRSGAAWPAGGARARRWRGSSGRPSSR